MDMIYRSILETESKCNTGMAAETYVLKGRDDSNYELAISTVLQVNQFDKKIRVISYSYSSG